MAVYPLTRTFSISPDSLYHIRAAAGRVAGVPDGLISQYWDGYSRSFRDENPDPGDVQRDRAYSNSFRFERKAIRTYTAVLDYENNSSLYSEALDSIRTYLYTFPWEIYQNALRDSCYYPHLEATPTNVPDDWDVDPNDNDASVWWDLDAYQRAREMSYNLILMSYIVDMLYYAHDRTDSTATAYTQFESILTNLQAHVSWIHSTFFNYGLPNSPADGWYNTGWNIYDLYAPNDQSINAPLGMCADNKEL